MPPPSKAPYRPLTYATMDPEERARRQAIMDTILAKHERESAERKWLSGRQEALVKEAQAWEQAQQIRRYVATLDERIVQGAQPVEGYATWREESLKVADMLDPTRKHLITA